MRNEAPVRCSPGRLPGRLVPGLVALWLCGSLSGCVAVTNPVANGIPVRRLPPELLAEPRADKDPISLSLLRQRPPDAYKLASGDILGVWIEGVLGERNQTPPVNFPDSTELPPALGFPIPVRPDGTVTLPLVEPVKVEGMTVEEAQEAIRRAYTVKKQILQPGRDRIIVTLMRRRHYHILVIRQDSPGTGAGGEAPPPPNFGRGVFFNLGGATTGPGARGTGFSVDLPAYENDLLNALARTGGLPGTDAVNEVLIERGSFRGQEDRANVIRSFENLSSGCDPMSMAGRNGGRVTRVPLRMRPGEQVSFRAEDIVLRTGDIVFIQRRQADFFYTSGVLYPGQYELPRDYDLDVIEALLRVGGPLLSSGINPSNINGSIVSSGLGFPSPSLLTVLRRTPGCGQVPIRVDLTRALRDPRERILVQAGDVLILQEKPQEGFARYFTSTFFNFNLMWQIVHERFATGTVTVNAP